MQTIEDFIKTHSGKLEIYTDGSRGNDGRASCSFVVPSMSIEKSFRLSNKTSIHAAEMVAIKLALEWATLVDHHQLVIYSDSLYVLQAIEQRQSLKRPNLLRDLLTSHEVYSRGRKAEATLVWIPAHLGIEGNEQADMLAKSALTSPTVDIMLNLEFCEAKAIYREHFQKRGKNNGTIQ